MKHGSFALHLDNKIFRGFNFREWILTREKCRNKSLVKITNHTVVFMGLDSYLLQCFQVLVHSQSISQRSGSRNTSFIKPKTVHEREQLVQVVIGQ